MAENAASTDRGPGLATLFSLVAIGGALLMYLGAGEPLSGWGFALAMVAGGLAVAAAHAR